MTMEIIEVTTFLATGAIAGWLAGVIMDIRSFGVIGNIILGISGAIAATFILGLIGITSTGIIMSIIVATAGAAVLLFLTNLIR